MIPRRGGYPGGDPFHGAARAARPGASWSVHHVGPLCDLEQRQGAAGEISEDLRQAITRAGLPLRSPFKGFTATSIAKAFNYLARKLLALERIRARYSVHDLRHAFAGRLSVATHDVYQVDKALGHATVGVTETYLQSLGVE
jgi:integrase